MEEKYKKIIGAAQAGGQVLKHYFGQDIEIKEKSMPSDFVTKADLEAEEAVLNILKENYPDYNIHSEEAGETEKGSDYTFIIDPLDGTNNFVLGIPIISTNIALLEKGQVIFSVVYDPILDNLFYAAKGGGAFLNNKKLQVNKVSDIERATISFICPYKVDRRWYSQIAEKLYTDLNVKRVLSKWSPSLEFCWLASGKTEALISKENETYDIIPGKLIAKEAGAVVIDLEGNPESDSNNMDFIISNNKKISLQLLKVLK